MWQKKLQKNEGMISRRHRGNGHIYNAKCSTEELRLHGLRQDRKWETAALNETENRCGWAWQDQDAEAELIQNRTQKINQKMDKPINKNKRHKIFRK